MKRLFVLFTVLLIIIATMTVGMASVYTDNKQHQPSKIILLTDDIETIRSGRDLSDTAEKREVFKDILLCMGFDEDTAEKYAQHSPEQAVNGIVNAKQIGGAIKDISDGIG